jgi:hypothetical protein
MYLCPKGNDAFDIYKSTHVIAYLQVGEVPFKLKPKECD